jgi:hypothetical protein
MRSDNEWFQHFNELSLAFLWLTERQRNRGAEMIPEVQDAIDALDEIDKPTRDAVEVAMMMLMKKIGGE